MKLEGLFFGIVEHALCQLKNVGEEIILTYSYKIKGRV